MSHGKSSLHRVHASFAPRSRLVWAQGRLSLWDSSRHNNTPSLDFSCVLPRHALSLLIFTTSVVFVRIALTQPGPVFLGIWTMPAFSLS